MLRSVETSESVRAEGKMVANLRDVANRVLGEEIQDQGREDIQGFLYSKAGGHWALGN